MKVQIIMEALTGRFNTDMDKTRKKLDRDVRAMRQQFIRVTAAASAFITTIAGISRVAITAAAEISRLSQVAGATPREFQRWAAAAQVVGVEQDKLADIFKDFQDRVGDFIQTGGGPMADFFEQIAPQVGVTAEQFRRLSGPEALQLYVDSLEKAGIAQSDMVFFLETMASDVTRLMPLLANGGAELERLADQAENVGAVMDNETIASLTRADEALQQVNQSFTGMRNIIGAAAAPALESIARSFSDMMQEGEPLRELIETLASNLDRLVFYAGAAVSVFGVQLVAGLSAARIATLGLAGAMAALRTLLLRTGIGLLIVGIGELAFRWDDLFGSISEGAKGAVADLIEIEDQIQRLEERIEAQNTGGDGFNPMLSVGPMQRELEELQEEAERLRDSLSPEELERFDEFMNGASDSTDGARASMQELSQEWEAFMENLEGDEAVNEIDRIIEGLERQAHTVGETGAELELFRLRLLGASDAQLAHARDLTVAIELEEQLQEKIREAGQVYDATRTPLEEFNAEIERLNELRDTFVDGEPLLDAETFQRAVEAAEEGYRRASEAAEDFGDTAGENAEEASRSAQSAARKIQDAFADFLFDPFENGLKGMLQAWVDALRRMAAEAATAQIFDALFPDGLGGILDDLFGIGGGVDTSGGGGSGSVEVSVGGAARGSAYFGGGLTWVGEEGPELVSLPRGAAVYPHQESMRMLDDRMSGISRLLNTSSPINVRQPDLSGMTAPEPASGPDSPAPPDYGGGAQADSESMQRADDPQTLDVRLFVDQDGNWQAAVEGISARVSARTLQRATPEIVNQSVEATFATASERKLP